MRTLEETLCYRPQELKFGTSGRRGRVVDLTQLEVYINALAELEYLQSLTVSDGGIVRGDPFCYASDLRPSSTMYVAEENGRGEIAQAIERAIEDSGMKAVNCGKIPTPALASYALEHGYGSMMITGSHIPFDRNGYKTNTAIGELLKKDESPIQDRVERIRRKLYSQPYEDSLFNEQGLFRCGHRELKPEFQDARSAFIRRYTGFFEKDSLRGKRILVYQHSAVGRDLLEEILKGLGAEVISAGRSDVFIPVDTENVDDEQISRVQSLIDSQTEIPDALVSTDGDSDRPLIFAITGPGRKARFFCGDLVGILVAEYLQADAVVVPISCNDAVDGSAVGTFLQPKTRLGSPFVIAGMQQAISQGKKVVCGWEANGGFLLGSNLCRKGKILRALPTRDAMLPIVCLLQQSVEKQLTLSQLMARLPRRFTRSALLRHFPRSRGLQIVERFSNRQASEERRIPPGLADFFPTDLGFHPIAHIDTMDGLRITFTNREVAHIRPSGNADELRFYTLADTQERADQMASYGVAEPDGILRRLEKALLL